MMKGYKRICRIENKNLYYLKDDGSEDKNAKGARTCVIKRKLKFED